MKMHICFLTLKTWGYMLPKIKFDPTPSEKGRACLLGTAKEYSQSFADPEPFTMDAMLFETAANIDDSWRHDTMLFR